MARITIGQKLKVLNRIQGNQQVRYDKLEAVRRPNSDTLKAYRALDRKDDLIDNKKKRLQWDKRLQQIETRPNQKLPEKYYSKHNPKTYPKHWDY